MRSLFVASGIGTIGGLIVSGTSALGGAVASSPEIKDSLGILSASAGALAAGTATSAIIISNIEDSRRKHED